MASSFVRSKSLSSIRVPNPSPLVPSKFSSSFQISNFPKSVNFTDSSSQVEVKSSKRTAKNEKRFIGNQVFARAGSLRRKRCFELLGFVRGSPTSRPEPRSVQESN
ncbi:unnamed protein product [Fraxinus pennsylvanica]|uniref:Uncharacterized protein n=1 Tax=Fraxinus pennsylvanica TaxID=56036 RepID=A0AAD2E4Z7_9LAMI|nr:unnamed protein product [Fraxinus pennsylvanica]